MPVFQCVQQLLLQISSFTALSPGYPASFLGMLSSGLKGPLQAMLFQSIYVQVPSIRLSKGSVPGGSSSLGEGKIMHPTAHCRCRCRCFVLLLSLFLCVFAQPAEQREPSSGAIAYCSRRSPIRRDYGRSEECGAAAEAQTKTVNWFQMCSGRHRGARLLVIRADPPGKRMRATLQTWGKTEFQRSRRRRRCLFWDQFMRSTCLIPHNRTPPYAPHLRVDDTCQIKHGGGGGPSGSERSRRSNARQIRKTYFFATTVGLVVGRTSTYGRVYLCRLPLRVRLHL